MEIYKTRKEIEEVVNAAKCEDISAFDYIDIDSGEIYVEVGTFFIDSPLSENFTGSCISQGLRLLSLNLEIIESNIKEILDFKKELKKAYISGGEIGEIIEEIKEFRIFFL